MKQSIAAIISMTGAILHAQTTLPTSFEQLGMSVPAQRSVPEVELLPWRVHPLNLSTPTPTERKRIGGVVNFELIGNTYWDFQTWRSAQSRAVDDPVNGWSGVWQMILDTSAGWTQNGVGYNQWIPNGGWGPIPAQRINQQYRNFYPTLGRYEKNGTYYDYVLSHANMFFSRRSLPSGTWNNTIFGLSSTNNWVFLYPSTVAADGYLYAISIGRAYDGQQIIDTVEKGVVNPMIFFKYNINSGQWENNGTTLPGYDSSIYSMASVLGYNIDARDSIVAIITGGIGDHIILWKSTDWGATFTHTYIDRWPDTPNIAQDGSYPDSVFSTTTDGSVDVVIDDNGKVHAFWAATMGLEIMYAPDSSETRWYPSITAIGYWNEDNAPDSNGYAFSGLFLDAAYDKYGDGSYNVNDLSYALSGGARYWYTAGATHVNGVVLPNGRLLVVYDALVDSAFSIDGPNYRDVWAFYYDGSEWDTVPKNLTDDELRECVFPYAPPRVSGDTLRVMFQRDNIPGTALLGQHPGTLNEIVVANVPIAKIADGTIKPEGNNYYTGVLSPQVETTIRLWPNPACEMVWIELSTAMTGPKEVIVQDMTGRSVRWFRTFEQQLRLPVDNLSPGSYIVRVSDGKYFSVARFNKQ